MNGGLYINLSGIISEGNKMNIITNNLANINTVGYKSEGSVFGDFLSQKAISAVNAGDKKPLADNQYPIMLYSYNNFSQGALKHTGNRLDLAISGKGFFVVKTPEGIKYTRNGSFSLNSDNQIVTQEGYLVLGTNGKPISLTERGSNITISQNGIINILNPQTNENQYAGKIGTVDFKNSSLLSRNGNTLFSETKKSGKPVLLKNPKIEQGYIEESNVNEIQSMVELIDISQVKSTMNNVLKSYSQIDNVAINTVGAAV